jgi:hypothetical protein
MSAGLDHPDTDAMVTSSLDLLAPQVRIAAAAALKECNDERLDAIAYETRRSDELQRIYYQRGRTVIPPSYTVTNVASAQYGWHFFGLALDVISASKRWDVTPEWRHQVTEIFKRHGFAAGAEWPHPDEPHYQWAKCRRSPSDEARSLYAEGGLEAVWQAVGAAENQ